MTGNDLAFVTWGVFDWYPRFLFAVAEVNGSACRKFDYRWVSIRVHWVGRAKLTVTCSGQFMINDPQFMNINYIFS